MQLVVRSAVSRACPHAIWWLAPVMIAPRLAGSARLVEEGTARAEDEVRFVAPAAAGVVIAVGPAAQAVLVQGPVDRRRQRARRELEAARRLLGRLIRNIRHD